MNGKDKCRILKEIRRQIAQDNDIDLVIAECTHKGECRGTCPRCEAEVAYLERELDKRRTLQKRVALAGIAVGVTAALTGCSAIDMIIDNLPQIPRPTDHIEMLEGEVPYEPDPTPEVFVTDGLMPYYDMVGSGEGGN